ncbi:MULTISPECIES: LPS translocon maturation chaperone LptM [unclassified Caballeronia]|uniref:LPS translocon maturation chaperone LptM n=1 Tax=unclassified Caballeronia TaxID=2646786 RepID=UPI0028623719|nr:MULTISPECIES: lipoprotein [unclassified Caballeronia]MDR5751841.1 lipoprotein [Caballeronia sp. LZ024]MDR5844019.1 lipoprotein [Caballeronia sp. LZ031]
MRVVFRMSAIVTALAVSAVTAGALGGCGQRGPLYLPATPPLPQRPGDLQETSPSGVTPSGETASRTGKAPGASDDDSVPDTSGEPLTLSPDTDLKSGASAPKAASSSN